MSEIMSRVPENRSSVPPSTSSLTDLPEGRRNGAPYRHSLLAQVVDTAYLPGGKRSLSGISIRAYGLGIALGVSAFTAVQLLVFGYPIWRAPFFIATLALFHYLEFDSTARFNPSDAKVSSYLLSANGSAYNIAHTAAMTEVLVRHWLYSSYKPSWLRLPFSIPQMLPTVPSWVPVTMGLILIVMGQCARTAAMAEAGKSFNHIVQSTRKQDHVLVTTGVYAFSRHPSYFGFFWWGLGTQLVLGNAICFPAYAFVLWQFFASRIASERPCYEFADSED
jgi:protein-S-isoprenylcysteine O-methyltransferase